VAAYHRIDLTPALDEKAMRIKAMKDQARIAGVPKEKLDLIDKLFYARRAELQIPEEYAKEIEKAIRERRGHRQEAHPRNHRKARPNLEHRKREKRSKHGCA